MTEAGKGGPRDSAGVLLPPPLIYLAAILLGVLAQRALPLALPGRGLRLVLGWGIILLGMAVIVLGARELRRLRTTLNPAGSTTALATGGPYGRTRNPLYLALSIIHLGVGVATGNPWILLTLAPAVLVIHFAVIRREERYLERKFGEEYRRYRSEVRRWL